MTDTERKTLAGQLSQALASEVKRNDLQAVAKRPAEDMTLFGIEQHQVDLLLFRQDVLERIADLKAQPPGDNPEYLNDLIADAEAELSTCDLELKRLAGQEVAKVDSCANLLRMCDRMTAFCKDERDRMNRKAKRWETIKEGVEGVVMEALALANRTSFDSPANRLRVQRNSSPKVEILDGAAIPSRFVKVTVEVTADRWKQMKEALPELAEFCTEKERTFITGAISTVLKKAAKEEDAARQTMEGPDLEKTLKAIERVRGAELRYGKHLRCE